MKPKISCFLPCRTGSERVPRKNIRPFYEYQHGLVEIKLNQLLACDAIDEVMLSTDDVDIINYAKTLKNNKLRVHKRVAELCSSDTSTDQLVAHASNILNSQHILWTHVTSPFVSTNLYTKIIETYLNQRAENYDSLMTVTPIYSFLWDHNNPINYDRDLEKWPRTQTLTPVYEINSAAFLADHSTYRHLDDRIGVSPYLYQLDKIQATDIDWEEDFLIAEHMLSSGLIEV